MYRPKIDTNVCGQVTLQAQQSSDMKQGSTNKTGKVETHCLGWLRPPVQHASSLPPSPPPPTPFLHSSLNRLLGLLVKASASRAEDPGFESRLRWDFSGSSHTSDLKIGTPVAATLPGAWCDRVSIGTGWPCVSTLGEMESLIFNFFLSVAARKLVRADLSLRYSSLLLGRYAISKQTNPPHTM